MACRAPIARRILSLWSLTLLLWCTSFIAGQQVPAELLAKALNHAKLMQNPDETIQQLEAGNIDTLYKVAKSLSDKGDRITSVRIWHILADGEANHVLSQVALGFSYSKEDKAQAIKYFVQAGEDGPHQAALYNAGRLFLETDDLVRALAYIRAAATLVETEPLHARPQMTTTSRQAYDKLSQQLLSVDLSMQQAADMFPYAHISDFPKADGPEDELWRKAMTDVQSYAESKDVQYIKTSQTYLGKLQDHPELSELQKHLLRTLMMHMLSLLKDEL